MVRLVFRPYTRMKRTICTSVPLHTSIRISTHLMLYRHSSPSFGSKQICSNSYTPLHMLVASNSIQVFTFVVLSQFSMGKLAHLLNSLVRVSRRVEQRHVRCHQLPQQHNVVSHGGAHTHSRHTLFTTLHARHPSTYAHTLPSALQHTLQSDDNLQRHLRHPHIITTLTGIFTAKQVANTCTATYQLKPSVYSKHACLDRLQHSKFRPN